MLYTNLTSRSIWGNLNVVVFIVFVRLQLKGLIRSFCLPGCPKTLVRYIKIESAVDPHMYYTYNYLSGRF